MRRLLVPAILVALVAVQVVSLFQSYRRSQVSVVEVVYRAPSAVFIEALDAGSMARLFEQAVQRSAARQGELRARFEVSMTRVIARFSLLEGDANTVARNFAELMTTVGFGSMLEKMSRGLTGTPAAGCSACLAKFAPQGLSRVDLAPGAQFVVERMEQRRSPWVRPLDVVALSLYLVAFVVWLPRRPPSTAAQPQR